MQTGGFDQYYDGLLQEIRRLTGERIELEPGDVPPILPGFDWYDN